MNALIKSLSSLTTNLDILLETLNLDSLLVDMSRTTQAKSIVMTVSIILTSSILLYYYLPDLFPSKQKSQRRKTASISKNETTKEKFYVRQQKYRHTVEICLSGIESVRNAIQSGANSVEICSDSAQGGITPSLGLVSEAVRMCRGIDVEVHCLIRPRPGLFTYSDTEFDCILRDILAVKSIGASGTIISMKSLHFL